MFLLFFLWFVPMRFFAPDHHLPVGTVQVVIDKSDYALHLYDAEGWYASFPVVFGSSDQRSKVMEGDKKTPEGQYRIIQKKSPHKWHRFLLLDYPNAGDLARFKQLQAEGVVPINAKPGGGIGIHGTWPKEDWAVDRFQNWTEGCISMKNEDIAEVFAYLPIGTTVIIQP